MARRLRIGLLATVLVVAGLGAALPAPPADAAPPAIPGATPVGTVTLVESPGFSNPGPMVTAPNGDVWFVNSSGIGRIEPEGASTIFHDPGIDDPQFIAVGSDGNIWFTNERGSVGRITPAGVVTAFGIGDVERTHPREIVAGADGALWIAVAQDVAASRVVRLSTAGVVSEPGLPALDIGSVAAGADGSIWYEAWDGSVRRFANGVVTDVNGGDAGSSDPRVHPRRMVVAADGNLWFTNPDDTIGTLTPAGVVTIHADPAMHSPRDIVEGPDGALWFTNGDSSVARITTAGVVTAFNDSVIDEPNGIAAGRDGEMWFSNGAPNTIVRMTTDGQVLFNFTNPGIAEPQGITTGGDGNLWYTNGQHAIGRTTPSGSVATYVYPKMINRPRALVAGSDGAIWFLNENVEKSIGRIATSGEVTTFPGPTVTDTSLIATAPDGGLRFFADHKLWKRSAAGALSEGADFTPDFSESRDPSSITVDAQGNTWMTIQYARLSGGGQIGASYVARIRPAGGIDTVPTDETGPNTTSVGLGSIMAGDDGSIWLVRARHQLVRVSPALATSTFETTADALISDLTTGPDGALWFTARRVTGAGTSASIGTMTTSGAAKLFDTPNLLDPRGITAGPDGALWFTDVHRSTIGRITATVSAAFHPLVPTRLLDSRTPVGAWNGSLTASAARNLKVAGGIVPSTASAVVLNVTATASTAGSFLTVWPAGGSKPDASNLNFGAGQTIANLTTVPVGADGNVSFATAVGAVEVVADVVGYYDDGGVTGDLFNPMVPLRALDTRTSTGGWHTPLVAGAPRDLTVRGPGGVDGVPATATAVVANVTVTGSTAGSHLTTWRSGDPQPVATNLNFGPGQTIANMIVVPLSPEGRIRLATAVGATDVVVDVIGWFDPSAGLRFHATAPHRVLDSRDGTSALGPWEPAMTRRVVTTGPAALLAGAQAQMLNITATDATTGSYLQVSRDGDVLPTSSTLNFGPGETIANLSVTRVSPSGAVAIRNHAGTVHVVADSSGYYAPT